MQEKVGKECSIVGASMSNSDTHEREEVLSTDFPWEPYNEFGRLEEGWKKVKGKRSTRSKMRVGSNRILHSHSKKGVNVILNG